MQLLSLGLGDALENTAKTDPPRSPQAAPLLPAPLSGSTRPQDGGRPPPAPAAPALHAALLRPPGPAPPASALPRVPIRARTAWSPPRPTEPRLTMTAARTPRAPACLAAAQPEKEDLVAAQPLPALWCPSAPHPVPPPSRPAALTRRLGSPHTPHPRCAAPRSPPQSLPPHPVGPPPPPALRDSFLAEGFGVTAVPSPKSSF